MKNRERINEINFRSFDNDNFNRKRTKVKK